MDTGTSLNLNTGGEVFDVEYLEVIDKYVVVGKFSSIGGVSCSNIAFLDEYFDVDPLTWNSVFQQGANAPIHAVAAYRYYIGGGVYTTAIHIGGVFTSFGGQTRMAAARLEISDDQFNYIANSETLEAWNPDFDFNYVSSIEVWSNRIIYCGEFTTIHSTTSPVARERIALFWGNTGSDYTTIDHYPMGMAYSFETVWDIGIFGSYIYLAANADEYIKMNPAGTYAIEGPPNLNEAIGMSDLDDSLMLIGYNYLSGGGDGITMLSVLRKSDLTEKTDHAFSLFDPGVGGLQAFDTYNEVLYSSNNSSLLKYETEDINLFTGIQPSQTIPLSGSLNYIDINFPYLTYGDNLKSNIMIKKNVLFCSYSNLTAAAGNSRIGLAAFCLPPKNQGGFISPDVTVCQNDVITYTVNAAEHADGYEWSYTGTGVDFNTWLIGDQATFDSTVSYREVQILENFTPGVLSVIPYSTCGGNTVNGDRLYGEPITVNLNLEAVPDASAGLDTVINCYNDSITLTGSSMSVNINYYWNRELNPLGNNYAGQDYIATEYDNYILKVEAANGCLGFDTVLVDVDTIRPNFDPLIADDIGCNDTVYVAGVCNNGTDTLNWWQEVNNTTQLPNPLTATVQGSYRFYTQFTGNGCVDSTEILLGTDQNPPDIGVNNYTLPPLGSPIAYITCDSTTLTFEAITTTANTVINWTDEDTLSPIGSFIVVNDSGSYYIHAYNSDNNCHNFFPLKVGLNTNPPVTPVIIPPASVLNCSNDSLILDGTTSGSNSLEWTGLSIPPSGTPLAVYDSGYYTLTATSSVNGCASSDSILIVQDNSIDVLISSDTVGCDKDPITVSADYVGGITGITYAWDNGTNTSIATYTAGNDSLAIVEINGDGGCYGTDTVRISIPPYPTMEVQGFAPCGTPNSGYLVFSPLTGWGPFEYSDDGGANFQTSSTITGLDVGTYTVTVRDTLGCTYDFVAELTEDAAPPAPDFLLSTENYETDTIAIVNISSPMPDSADWIFPPEMIILDDNDTLPLVILPDTGTFFITIDAWYGTCLSSLTKEVHVSEFDTTIATSHNANGIKSMQLYPNPNNGSFTVEVEFYKKQNVELSITDMSGVEVTPASTPYSYFKVDQITAQFNLDPSLIAGTYVLRIAAEYDSAYITFILNP